MNIQHAFVILLITVMTGCQTVVTEPTTSKIYTHKFSKKDIVNKSYPIFSKQIRATDENNNKNVVALELWANKPGDTPSDKGMSTSKIMIPVQSFDNFKEVIRKKLGASKTAGLKPTVIQLGEVSYSLTKEKKSGDRVLYITSSEGTFTLLEGDVYAIINLVHQVQQENNMRVVRKNLPTLPI